MVHGQDTRALRRSVCESAWVVGGVSGRFVKCPHSETSEQKIAVAKQTRFRYSPFMTVLSRPAREGWGSGVLNRIFYNKNGVRHKCRSPAGLTWGYDGVVKRVLRVQTNTSFPQRNEFTVSRSNCS